MKTKHWLLVSFLVGSSLAAVAQRADGVYHIACMVQMNDAGDGKKIAECTTHPRQNAEVGIGGKVSFDVTTTHELMDEEGAPEVTDLNLVLDGQPLPGTHPVVENQTDERLPAGASDSEEKNQDQDWVVTFRLTFPVTRDLSSTKGKESWAKLLGGLGKERKEVPVSIGLINGPPLPSTYKVEFVRLGGTRLTIFLLVAIVLGIGFLVVAFKTGALRDKEPPPLDASGKEIAITPEDRVFSLSRMQIAVWTLLVVYAYLFIFLITGEYNTEIPRTILAILGISAGTYATAAAVDKEKERGTGAKGTTVTKTEGMFPDLLSTNGGASLHRVQFGLWSIVLMIVFAVTVYDTLAMPDFHASLLALMGISSATYAGMKIPETKA
ncbi:MAG: hypothetical protein LAO30_01605 [Acidobacteriia bacterium]|nr:hypothetical protein [Terriglobia bacterium]